MLTLERAKELLNTTTKEQHGFRGAAMNCIIATYQCDQELGKD